MKITATPIPSKTLFLLVTLYLAQGLPSGFITQALPAILRQYNVSLAMIGWSGLLLVPWGIKFIWAPVVDRFYSAKFGQSRSWIVPLQLLSVVVLLGVAFFNPENLANSQAAWVLYAWLFMLNMMGATHDVAADALATRSVAHKARGYANAAQVTGYRLGLILGGGVLLMLLDHIGWRYSFLLMGVLILFNTLPIVRYQEPQWHNQTKHQETPALTDAKTTLTQLKPSLWVWLTQQYGYFIANKTMRAWLLVLLTFKVTDGISSGMVKPMMVDMGIALGNIGFWVSVLGSLASLLGAALAGWLLHFMSRFFALLIFNALQVATTGLYALVAWQFERGLQPSFWQAYAANAVEHAAAAMALVAMLSCVMDYSRQKHAGSDFTFQVCMLTAFSGVAHILSGYIADYLGYTAHFAMSVGLGCVLLLPIIYWYNTVKKMRSDTRT